MADGFPNTKRARLAALRAVIDPDTYADYRKICRWFSRTFNTPLLEVYDLSSDFVLQHYLEDQYEALEHDERRAMLIELTETPEERIERLRKESEEEHLSYTESKATLDTVLEKIAKMKGSDIKEGLETYRAELAEKQSLKDGAAAEKKAPSAKDVLKALQHDKKVRDGAIHFVLPRAIGRVEITPDVPFAIVRDVVKGILNDGKRISGTR